MRSSHALRGSRNHGVTKSDRQKKCESSQKRCENRIFLKIFVKSLHIDAVRWASFDFQTRLSTSSQRYLQSNEIFIKSGYEIAETQHLMHKVRE
jgi:hypothetical protein